MTFTIRSLAALPANLVPTSPAPAIVELLDAWTAESYAFLSRKRSLSTEQALRLYRNAEICRRALVSAINDCEVFE